MQREINENTYIFLIALYGYVPKKGMRCAPSVPAERRAA